MLSKKAKGTPTFSPKRGKMGSSRLATIPRFHCMTVLTNNARSDLTFGIFNESLHRRPRRPASVNALVPRTSFNDLMQLCGRKRAESQEFLYRIWNLLLKIVGQ